MTAETTAGATKPHVRVVVVNFNGGDLTLACLRALTATDWSRERLEIVLVDNASDDGVVDRVNEELPLVQIIRASRNLGFAGGCNLALSDRSGVDYVALVNNDAVVEPGWLKALVDVASVHPDVGAVNPKVLLATRFFEVVIRPLSSVSTGRLSSAEVRVHGVAAGEADLWSDSEFAGGFSDVQHAGRGQNHYRALIGPGRILVPSGRAGAAKSVRLLLSARHPTAVEIGGATHVQRHELDPQPRWITTEVCGDPVDVVNSVGGEITTSGYGSDRGFLERDTGSYDELAPIETWTGSVVLLSAAYLDDVGLFDETFFLYYEDFDLAWRGRKRGWRYLYTPATTARHVRGASSERGARLLAVLNHRNRLLTILKNAPPSVIIRALGRDVLVTASYLWRDTGRRLLRRERPDLRMVRQRLAGHASFLSTAPRVLLTRRPGRSGARKARSMLS